MKNFIKNVMTVLLILFGMVVATVVQFAVIEGLHWIQDQRNRTPRYQEF